MHSLVTRVLVVLLLSLPVAAAAGDKRPPRLPKASELDDAIREADRLVVSLPLSTDPLLIIQRASVGREFLALAAINEHAEPFHCMCYGDVWLTFFQAGKEKARLGFHHARSIRWHDGPWEGDAELRGDSGIRISQWLKSEGYPKIEDDRLATIAYEQKRSAELNRFWEHLPTEMKELFERDPASGGREDTYARRTIRACSDHRALLVSLFRAFGNVPPNDGDNGPMAVGRKIVELLDPSLIEAALDAIRDDDLAMRGAAALFCRTPFLKNLPPARACEWGQRLAQISFEAFDDSSKDDAMLRLAFLPGPSDVPLLLEIASGKRPVTYTKHLTAKYRQEPELRAAACLALAMRKSPRAAEYARQIREHVQDISSRAAVDLTLWLAANEGQLRPEYFKLSSFLIGYAGIEALRRIPADQVPTTLMGAALQAPYARIRDQAEELAEELGFKIERRRAKHNSDEISIDGSQETGS